MSAEPIESLATKIITRYNKRPVGWKVITDFKGNVLVLGQNDGYLLKIVAINPREYTGVGMKIDNPREMRTLGEGTPSYGFRPLSRMQTKELLTSFRHEEKRNKRISEILKKNPVSILDLEAKRPNAVLSGPFITHPDLSTISKNQRELELKLKIEAAELFRKKYPQKATMYS